MFLGAIAFAADVIMLENKIKIKNKKMLENKLAAAQVSEEQQKNLMNDYMIGKGAFGEV